MKKYALLLAVICVCLFVPFVKADIVDYYAVGNYSSELLLDTPHPSAGGSVSARGQSFNATQTMDLTECWFDLRKANNPAGNANAILYGHAGVFGTSSVPNATTLATSDNFAVAGLNGTMHLYQFTFSGANIRELQAGTQYCIAFVNPGAGIDAANHPRIGIDNTAPTHNGNAIYYNNGAWSAHNPSDIIFYLLDPTATAPINLVNTSDPTFHRDEQGEVNITVREWDHRSELNYHEIQVNTTGDTETFTLRWTEATNTFTEQADAAGIIVLNTSTRTFLDKWTVLLSYNYTMKGGQEGYCDVRAYARDDAANTDTDMYLNQYNFVYFNWNIVGDLINSLFSQFGIIDYFGNLITYITSLSTQYAYAIINIVSVVTQQFRIVTNIFTWTMRWFTRLVDMILTMGGIITGLLNGTGAVVTQIGDWWAYLELNTWYELVTLLAVILWIDSIANRGETQGEIRVFFDDMNTISNVLSYFLTLFNFVIDTVVNKVFQLLDAIQ